MKRFFILVVMLACLTLFAEGNPKPQHTCYNYQYPPAKFVPAWFDFLEFADDNDGPDYSREFLQEHGGRVGTLVYQYQRNGLETDWTYDRMCSGTLIGENYFITAAHCATTTSPLTGEDIKIVGVLFGYQTADLYDDNDMVHHTLYPRVSLKGYLDDNEIYRLYGEEEPDEDIYPDFDQHPAYFPLADDDTNTYSDGSVEHGWDRTDDETEKVDYAIYKLGENYNHILPAKDEDPWPWRSENNQSSQNTLPANQVKPWILSDNTNGARGWARVNTAVQQPESTINVIGHPGVATIPDGNGKYEGLKVVNAGSVVDGEDRILAHSFVEDVLVFERADVMFGNSGSSVIDDSGRLAGVVSWTNCFKIEDDVVIVPDLTLSARTYATPIWKICKVSPIIKDAARDQNCNGIMDWWDVVDIEDIVNIHGLLIDRFGLHPIPLDLKNYWYDMDQKKVISEMQVLPPDTYQIALQDNGDFFYIAMQSDGFYLFKNGTPLGTIADYPYLAESSSLVKGNDIYFAGGYEAGGIQYLSSGNQNSGNTVQLITKISSDGQNGYNFSIVATLPSDFEDARIFALGNDIYVGGNTSTNFVVYKLLSNNTLILASDATQPVRKDYNLTASDGKIIVSGGATHNITSILGKTEAEYPSGFAVYNNIIMLEPALSTNWVTVAENINDKIIMLSVTAIDDGNLVIVNPFITVGNAMQKIVMDLSAIPINGENLRVEFEFDPVLYCLNETETAIQGGIGTSGECVPFAHPFYNFFSAGTTVYSIAGKGNRLYAGTNDSIKIYDISDQDSPVLVSSFSTNNARVNDLEIEGDVLFAATSKGLYKLDAGDPDELEQILFVSTGSTSQNEIELYDGKIYAGDDDGIKIRDKETLSVLLSANSGQAYDFAIENGEIAMFRSSPINSGIQFRNAETLVETAYDYTSCNDVEVENFNDKLYLACDNYTYSFEANNGYIYFTQLSGDKRDLRENYTYNGYTYTPDGNYIRLSTNEEVPAICGNGLVEGDEICDGTPIDCDELDPSYVSGIAACNSTCDGYVLDNCTAGNGGDGW